ncbi:MAG: bifunctional hydroxymethylpyrimidine kinase/phosphomethylpyrimidine kinase [Spirochaetota bacterium]|jgi:hydroxymethylpyrimidine/phosphomethylpyrimidine kinase|nr:bifunctional hydroxymethylpyrimidine kinase/phosphomethylpyrimidine kinase [Spirochaetota bacterium]
MQTEYTIALTIAGSDSGGGAGIQADLKTFSALGVYGASVITAITSQNTLGVQAVENLPSVCVASQLESVLSDLPVRAIKIGMVGDAAAIRAIAAALYKYKPQFVVLDPVMVAKSGDALLQAEALDTLRAELLPLASIITPNTPEAEALLGLSNLSLQDWGKINSIDEMKNAAAALLAMGPQAVYIKGGHIAGDACDILAMKNGFREFSAPRLDARHTHGTGCTLSSAIAAFLARGFPLEEAAERAKQYVFEAIRCALPLGQGIGPVHHFHALWGDE